MKQLIQDFKSGQLHVVDVPVPALQSGCVLVRNVSSLVSAGTERATVAMAQKSLLAKARARPDLVKKVLDSVRREGFASAVKKVQTRLDTWKQLGYSSAGLVLEAGVEGFARDDRVACAGQDIASHAEIICVPRNLCVKIPDSVEFAHAAFTTLGAIALQGVRQAKIEFGEVIAVIGLGLVGQLTVQILKAAGTRVLGIDLNPDAAKLALQSGADALCVSGKDDPVAAANALTNGVGLDAVLITASTASNDPVELAAQLCRDRARVVMIGVTGMNIPRAPYHDKELSLTMSRSYGPGRYDPDYEQRGIDYPFGYVRWTENRNMEAFLALIAQKRINLLPLITHEFPIDRATEAYDLITGKRKERFLAVLIRYDSSERPSVAASERHAPHAPTLPRSDVVRFGVIGAGNYAQASLLPRLKRMKNVELAAVCTTSGVSARKAAEKFGFARATTDVQEILRDDSTRAVLIATRHDTHAQFAAAALRAGKCVFVEKPLALNEAQLKLVADVFPNCGEKIQVGFNRRFAPLARECRAAAGPGPLVMHYRVNAGPISPGNWIQDPELGGGRILGEVCHFVDFFQSFLAVRPTRVFAESIGSQSKEVLAADNVQATLRYEDGSVGLITYTSTGDPSFPKERCEIFGNGSVLVLDDFRSLTISREGKTIHKRATQDKGQASELREFVNAVRAGGPMPIPWQQLVDTTRVTFAILDSLRTGRPVEL